MTNPQLKPALDAVRKELSDCSEKNFTAAAPTVADLKIVLEAFDTQQVDLEGLVLVYVELLKASGEVNWWVNQLLATVRPATKGRAFVSKESADKLREVAKQYSFIDKTNRLKEQPISLETKTK